MQLPNLAGRFFKGIAEPDDITGMVLFLASDAARYLCGSLIEVNGGKPVK